MDKSKLDQIVSIIDDTDDMTIATIRDDGFPQATTVSYINDGSTIYFAMSGDCQKAKNIEKNNKISLTINRPYDSWNDIVGLSIGGHAIRVTDKAELDKVNKLILGKFPQIADLQTADMKMEAMAVFRISPVVFSLLDYRKGFGHTELIEA